MTIGVSRKRKAYGRKRAAAQEPAPFGGASPRGGGDGKRGGDVPLTGTSARRIMAVVHLREIEKDTGIAFDLDTISGSGTSAAADFSTMKPDLKDQMMQNLARLRLLEQHPDMTPQQREELIERMSNPAMLEIANQWLDRRTPMERKPDS